MAPTLLWYDLETFGRDPRWDRIGQFAALRTDYRFTAIAEPVSIYCRLSPDYLPDPDSCLVSGLTPSLVNAKGMSEAELAGVLQREMSAPATCTVGFNTIRFDDEFVRNLFYRNFYDPYRREYENGNSRWDIIDLARMTRDLRPDGITWPTDDEGKPSFKLEELAAANGISHEHAHDALADVRATVALAALIHNKQPKLFRYYFKLRKRDEVQRRLNLQSPKPMLHTSGMFRSHFGCTTLVYPVSVHPENPNGIIAYDLRHDPASWIDLPIEEIHRRIFTRDEELEEGERIHLKVIHLNRSPAVAPAETLAAERAQALGIDVSSCVKNAERLREHPSIMLKVRGAFEIRKGERAAPRDPELQIYSGGFFGDQDRELFARVHASPPAEIIASPPAFVDPRGAELLRRYLARNHFDLLPASDQKRWLSYCASRLLAPEPGDALDYGRFRRRVENLLARTDTPARAKSILRDLLDYGAWLDRTVLHPSE